MDGAAIRATAEDFEYRQTTLQLNLGDRIAPMTDGPTADCIVEAHSATGELFGFDRTRDLSTRSAGQIARMAKAYGQSDDITVLTVTFAPAQANT